MDNDSRSPPSDRYPNPTPADAAASILPTTATTDDTSSSRRRLGLAEWPTIDGPLGLSHEDSLAYARRFFKLGFLCLPFLWAVNCFYFWPVLRNPHSHHSHPRLRRFGNPVYFKIYKDDCFLQILLDQQLVSSCSQLFYLHGFLPLPLEGSICLAMFGRN
ncbi:hypothetical protein Pfo_019029, partial [Paulownia fortunei]